MFGKTLAEFLTGADEASLPVPITSTVPVAGNYFKQELLKLAFATNQFIKSF